MNYDEMYNVYLAAYTSQILGNSVMMPQNTNDVYAFALGLNHSKTSREPYTRDLFVKLLSRG